MSAAVPRNIKEARFAGLEVWSPGRCVSGCSDWWRERKMAFRSGRTLLLAGRCQIGVRDGSIEIRVGNYARNAGRVVRATASEMEDGAEVAYSRTFIVRRIAFSGGEKDILVRSDGGEVLCPENREQGFTCESGPGGVGGWRCSE